MAALRVKKGAELAASRQVGRRTVLRERSQQVIKIVMHDSCPSGNDVRKLCEEGRLDEAFHAVSLMEERGICVSTNLFYHFVQWCINIKNLVVGRQVYRLIVRSGFASNTFLGSHLIRMFAQCGSLLEASQVFSQLPKTSEFAWSAIISAHAKLGQDERAINLFYQMQRSSIQPNEYIFVAVLKACTSIAALTQGKLAHSHIIKCGLGLNVYVCNTLVDMYAKCWSLHDARLVFDRLSKRSLVTWNAMLSGYAQHGHSQEVHHLFQQMQQDSLKPDNVTFVSILKACSSTGAIDHGRLIHALVIESGYECDVFVRSVLIDMYAKCQDLADANSVFDQLPKLSVVIWNAMIAGYVQHGQGQEALQIFHQMQQVRMLPDKVTFVSILKACAKLRALDEGALVHADIIERGLESDLFVGNSLIGMYIKCSSIDAACRLFLSLPQRDVVTWTALIGAHVLHGNGREALELYLQMQQEGMNPNDVTFVCILKLCSSITDLGQGKLIHGHILEKHAESNDLVGSALIDMYTKCGSLENACIVFDDLSKRSVVTWSAMMAGYALHGQYEVALKCFQDMQNEGIKPDDVTFLCLLSVCSEMGLVHQDHNHNRLMSEEHGFTPKLEHYTCMIDLLGHAGCLNEAEYLFDTMPLQPDIVGWNSLLSKCRRYGNVELGRRCFDRMVTMDGRYASPYMLMSNIYIDAAMHEHADNIHELRKSANVWKKAGLAFIELENCLHKFTVGETSHPQIDDINAKLKRLGLQIKGEGHVASVNLVLQS